MANISRDTFDKMKHYVSVRLQQGVPLVDADWNEMEDIRRFELQAFLKWFIGDGVPAGNEGFRIVEIKNEKKDFTIKGGDGTPEGAGRCLVEGWDVINESDLKYTDQRLHKDSTLAGKWKVDPLPELMEADSNRPDLVYLDIWEREVNEQEDSNLKNPVIGVPTCVRFKREWVVRVLENCNQSEVPSEIRKEGHAYYPLARKTGSIITDLRRTGLTLSNIRNGWLRLPFLPKRLDVINPATPNNEFKLFIFHASCDANGAAGSMEIPIPPGVNRINRFRIGVEKNDALIIVDLRRVNFFQHTNTSLLTKEIKECSSSFVQTWSPIDFVDTSLDPEQSALAVSVKATKAADISFIAVEFIG